MLHAAAMLIGLFTIAFFAAERRDLAEALTLAGAIAIVCVVFAARFGGIGRTAFSAPHLALLGLARVGRVFRGAFSTMRAAIAADITLKPALVRVRTRAQTAFAKAALVDLMSAAPGVVVVEAGADGMLAHVIDEDGVDAAEIGMLEAATIGALERRPRL